MHDFLLIFEYADESVFRTIHQLRLHLDIQCKGKYNLHVGFNNPQNGLAQIYNILAAPALINLKNKRIMYGDLFQKEYFTRFLIGDQ